jgi:hypothetical protein
VKCLKGNKMKNVIKFLCLLLASEVFAQEVNSEFLWSASEDSTERVITGSSDETSGYWYSFENGRGFNIWDMDQTGVDITKWQGLCVEYKSSSDMELLLINEEQQALSSNLKFGKLLKASDSVLTVNISWKNMEQLECCFDGVKIEDYVKKASAIHFIFNEETSLELLKIGSLNSCSKETNSFLNFKQKSFTLHVEKDFLNHFVVKGVSSDATFYLFDLNGKMLKQSILKNGSFETPTLPVVLKIHKKTFLLQ